MDATETTPPTLTEAFAEARTLQPYCQAYLDVLQHILRQVDAHAVAALADAIEAARQRDAIVFVVGNGGSAAAAAHWVNDLAANTVVPDAPGYRVISLSDSAASITALGNDVSFDEVFSRQLQAGGRPGDLLITMSVSGNSPNILRAIETADGIGMQTWALCGMDGGKAANAASHAIQLPSTPDAYGPVEDGFGVLMHIITGYLAQQRGRRLAH